MDGLHRKCFGMWNTFFLSVGVPSATSRSQYLEQKPFTYYRAQRFAKFSFPRTKIYMQFLLFYYYYFVLVILMSWFGLLYVCLSSGSKIGPSTFGTSMPYVYNIPLYSLWLKGINARKWEATKKKFPFCIYLFILLCTLMIIKLLSSLSFYFCLFVVKYASKNYCVKSWIFHFPVKYGSF